MEKSAQRKNGCCFRGLGQVGTAQSHQESEAEQHRFIIASVLCGRCEASTRPNDWAPVHQSIAGPMVFVLRSLRLAKYVWYAPALS